jgi:hypothetical protein
MGISVGCQVLSRVVYFLYGDLKHLYVYNFMDDLLLYSRSMEEHLGHLREVFYRLEKAGFTLNQWYSTWGTRRHLRGYVK